MVAKPILALWLLFSCGWAHLLRSSSHDFTVRLVTHRAGKSYEVSGAGESRVDGRYEQVDAHYDTYGGHPMYRPVDSSGKQILTAGEIYNQGGSWIIRHEDIPGSLYVGEGETPDTAAWIVGPAGKAPVPVVSLAGAAPAATTQATTTVAATPVADKEDLKGIAALVGLLLLLVIIVLICMACFLVGRKIVHDGDIYEANIEHSYGHDLGLDFEWKDGALLITAIHGGESLTKHFNDMHGDGSSDPCCIEVGHYLVEVNGIHGDEMKMREELAKKEPFNLIFRRHASKEMLEAVRKSDKLEVPVSEEPVPDAQLEEPLEEFEGGSSPEKASLGRGGDSNKSQAELDDILAKRRARDMDAGHVGSLASKGAGFDDETQRALARRRDREHGEEVPHIGSAAASQSSMHPELAARLQKQREAEEVLGGGTPKVAKK